jgi:hypothetical protein
MSHRGAPQIFFKFVFRQPATRPDGFSS